MRTMAHQWNAGWHRVPPQELRASGTTLTGVTVPTLRNTAMHIIRLLGGKGGVGHDGV